MAVTRWIRTSLWITSAFAVAFGAWVLTGRILDRGKVKPSASQKTAQSHSEFEATFLGRDLKIVQFYGRDAVVARGASTLLCYSVVNAVKVRIEPPVGEMRPSSNYCLTIAPAATRAYTLTAEDAAGKTVSQAVTIRVNPR